VNNSENTSRKERCFFQKQITPTDRNNATDEKNTEGKKMELIYEDLTRELIG
jgi:hypothetical protein